MTGPISAIGVGLAAIAAGVGIGIIGSNAARYCSPTRSNKRNQRCYDFSSSFSRRGSYRRDGIIILGLNNNFHNTSGVFMGLKSSCMLLDLMRCHC